MFGSPARRLLVVTAAAAAFFALTGAAAPPGTEHNCAGAIVSGLAGDDSLRPVGLIVRDLAHAQVVDNDGLADCDQQHRRNP